MHIFLYPQSGLQILLLVALQLKYMQLHLKEMILNFLSTIIIVHKTSINITEYESSVIVSKLLKHLDKSYDKLSSLLSFSCASRKSSPQKCSSGIWVI